jgi:NitT/TauT family transport system permease protein
MRAADRVALPIAALLAAAAVWHLAVSTTHTTVFPAPIQVMRGVGEIARRGLLLGYARDSLVRVSAGYLLAVTAGIPAGLLIGWYPTASAAVNPMVQMMRPISPLAWTPLAIVWFGIGSLAPIFLIFLAALFPILVATSDGVRQVAPVYRQAGENFGLSPRRLLWRVILPAALPQILIGLRLALGIAWLVVVAAEMIAVDSGLGYLIIDSRNAGKRYDLVVAGMLLIGLIGLGLDTGVRQLERLKATRWGFLHD